MKSIYSLFLLSCILTTVSACNYQPLQNHSQITFGIYPQTRISSEILIESLEAVEQPETNGWYLFENEYYAKVVAEFDPRSTHHFKNGDLIVSGNSYWFKCEPISWYVLEDYGETYYLLSSLILDGHRFNDYWTGVNENGFYPNNYEQSEIRNWLNSDFYETAFSLEKSQVQTTTVNNNASTTASKNNPYACNDTKDKVFLPSYKDFLTTKFGFASTKNKTKSRCCEITDYAIIKDGSNFYWTRSPSNYPKCSWYVLYDGSMDCGYALVGASFGIRPSIILRKE